MKEELLQKLEAFAGSDDFAYESEEIMEQIEAEGAGSEMIPALLGIMERHPLDDFGMPGPMVHFIERFHPDYVPQLFESVQRRPALHTVWMLHRCMNGSKEKEQYMQILKAVAENDSIEAEIRDSAKSFLVNE